MIKKDREIKYLSQEELKKFFDTIEKSGNKFWLRDLTAFNLIYYCGLRASELQKITQDKYRQDTREVQIERLKGSLNNTIRLDEKRAKLVNKYIKKYTGEKLYEIEDNYSPLFKSKNGKPLNLEAIRHLMKKYSSLCKLPKNKSHPHCLKHSIAVHLAESGVDVKDLQYYLGHKNINNTTIYFQYTTKQMDDFYQKLQVKNALV